MKQPRGEALSPSVKAELRWVTQGSGPHSANSGPQHRPEPKQRHMDKQSEMRLCAGKARTAKTAGQASGQAGRRASHSPQVRSGDRGGG